MADLVFDDQISQMRIKGRSKQLANKPKKGPIAKVAIASLFLFFNMGILVFGQNPILRQYTATDGLPSSNIYYTYQDSKGYIWVGSDKGIAKFDGYTFTSYTTKNGLPNNDVFGLVEDGSGKIWLNTISSLAYYQDGKIYNEKRWTSQGNIVSHIIDHLGNHFVNFEKSSFYSYANDSLILIKDGYMAKFDSYVFFDDLSQEIEPKTHINTKPDKSKVYIDGVFYEYEKEAMGIGTGAERFINVFSLGGKTAVFVYKDRIEIFEDGQLNRAPTTSFKQPLEFLHAGKLNDSLFWAETKNEIKVFDKTLTPQPLYNFLNNYQVNNLFIDKSDNLWTSTNSGLYFLAAGTRTNSSFKLGNSITENNVSAMEIDPDGGIWVGNGLGNLYSYQNGQIIQYDIPELKGDKIRAISISSREILVGGTKLVAIPINNINKNTGQVRAVNLNNTKLIGKDNSFLSAIKSSVTYHNDQFLVASAFGAFHVDKGAIAKILSRTRSYAVAHDKSDRIWIGHLDGLEVIINDSLCDLRGVEDLFNVGINDLAVDQSNRLWIATDGFGLHCYQHSSLITITELENEIINSIHIDAEGRVWAASNKGAIAIETEPGKASLFQYKIRQLTQVHGLPSDEVTHIRTSNDHIYIGTKNGVAILSKESIGIHHEPPVLYFTNIKINDLDNSLQSKYELKHNENNIQFSFVCLSYKSNKAISYFYKLVGIDKEWHKTTATFKEYTTLPSGDYLFKIKAVDVDGMQTNEKSIGFTIALPWWKTRLFIVIASLAAMAFILTIYKLRVDSIQKKAAQQNALDKRFAELELKALQSQMNPHFIFNTLNAIQDFMFQKDERTANRYLVKFSKLMRLILESSKEKYHTISDEIELLKLYVEIEKVRFANKFDFEFIIDESLENSTLNIPTMMTQPFVENAINHGLIYKHEKGKLTISMTLEDSHIKCTIEDNGVGRAKAMELKNQTHNSYKSRGMQLVNERLKMLSYIEKMDIKVTITDLVDAQGKASGTLVHILLPV